MVLERWAAAWESRTRNSKRKVVSPEARTQPAFLSRGAAQQKLEERLGYDLVKISAKREAGAATLSP